MRCLLILALLILPAQAAEPDFEVLVLGTYHAPAMFLGDDYTPAHIRATLIAARPDVVAVESHPKWFAAGRYHVVTYEAEGVAVPWARGLGIPAYGVDWKDIEAWDRMEEMRALQVAGPLKRSFALPPSYFGKLSDAGIAAAKQQRASLAGVDWSHINGVHDDAWAKSRFGGKSPEQPDIIGRRDRGIAENCIAAMKTHRGKRLVVVVGAHHKPFLDLFFGRMKNVRVLRLGRDVKLPSARDIAAAWTADDLVNSLAHTLDSRGAYFHAELANLPRARRLLKMLEKRDDRRAAYFAQRIAVLAGEPADFSALRNEPGALYPFPMREWRMQFNLAEAATLEQARQLPPNERAALLDPLIATLRGRLRKLDRDEPGVVRRVETIKDPGFEFGGRASDIFAGWDTYLPAGAGMLEWTGDETNKVEGERSLRVEVTGASAHAYPFHVRHEVSVPLSRKAIDNVTFRLSLRGEGVTDVTLSARPPWSSNDRTPLAIRKVALEAGRWTEAEISFRLPPARAFSLYVEFKGPKGAKLWLDGGTGLAAEYTTIPLAWSRLATAIAFLESLLTKTAETAVLNDAGFESGRLAPAPMQGWYSDDARAGTLRAAADEEVRTEGKRSLRIEVLKAKGGNAVLLSQAGQLPAGDEFELTLSLRTKDIAWVHIDVGIWVKDRFEAHGSDDYKGPGEKWHTGTIRFRPPQGTRTFGIFIAFQDNVGGRLWVDDAQLTSVKNR